MSVDIPATNGSATDAPAVDIEPPTRPLTPDELRAIAERVARDRSAWDGRLERDPSERTTAYLHRSEHLGVMAISWMRDDHDTGFHDHERSCGAVAVAEGVIRHELLRRDGTAVSRAVPAPGSYDFDAATIHRMRHEPGAGPTVTIHAYSPPLEATGEYTEGDDGELRRLRTPADEELRPRM